MKEWHFPPFVIFLDFQGLAVWKSSIFAFPNHSKQWSKSIFFYFMCFSA